MGAVLVIAPLDPLSRNVAMIERLMDSGLDFVATDFPYANKFTIHLLAAVAEYESRIHSERMKAIMAAVKQPGITVGKTKGDSNRQFPPAVNRQAPERGRRERKREDAISLRSFGSRSRTANRIASSLMSSTRPASSLLGRVSGPQMLFGGLQV
jgi:DNA invertase Pin-like site-specific DNA recombinase